MIYYCLLLLLLIIMCFFVKNDNKKHKKIAITIVVILLTLLAGLRHFSIGNDTIVYYRSYSRIAAIGSNAFSGSSFELGYNYLVLFATSLGLDFNVFLFIISLFMNIGVGVFIYKYSEKPMFSFILFILLRMFFSEMNIVREFFALVIFLSSVKYIEGRNCIKFLIAIILASFVHSSVFFAIIIYFLYTFKLTPVKKISLAGITVAVCVFLYNILLHITQALGMYERYVDDYFGSNKLASAILAIISILIYLFFIGVRKNNKNNEKQLDDTQIRRLDFYENILFFSIIFSVIAIRISIFSRLALYYQIFDIIAIPNAIRLISNPKKRVLWYIIVFVCFFAYFALTLYLRPNWNMVNPYRFFWE